MLRGRCLLLLRLKVNIDSVTNRKLRKQFILFVIVVVLRKALLEYYHALQGEFLVFSDLDGYLRLLAKAFLGAKNCDEAPEHHRIYLILVGR